MRTGGDVLRSFKKYVAELVIPEYEVRLSSEEGAWERPFCRVAWTTPATWAAHGARQAEARRTMQIVAWPLESDSPDEARVAAEALNERFVQGLSFGLHEPSFNAPHARRHPLRIPIYDYTGVPLDGVVDADARAVTDFARIPEPPSVGDIDDPNTDLSRIVIADIRVAWTRSTAIEPPGPLTQSVPLVGGPPLP